MFTELPTHPQSWLESALDEHRRAEYHMAAGDYGRTCFYCRRSAEKLFTSFILAYKSKPPKTHLLTRLLEQCAKHEEGLSSYRQAARHLEQYYIGDLPDERLMKRPYTEEEAKMAMTLIEHFIDSMRPFIVSRIEEIP
jgi:HEPN domain-containing protein